MKIQFLKRNENEIGLKNDWNNKKVLNMECGKNNLLEYFGVSIDI